MTLPIKNHIQKIKEIVKHKKKKKDKDKDKDKDDKDD